jgi:hypothetical protein
VKKTVATILSTNFAGSHFLSLMLGSHSRAQHVGEARRLRKRPRTKHPCFLCEASGECELFRDIDADGLEDLWPTLFSRVGEEILVLIDNSKKPSWAARFLADDRIDKKYIHLVRDPRALIRRWATDYDAWPKRIEQRVTWGRRRPDLLRDMLLVSHRRFFLYKWLAKNQEITEFLRANSLEHTIVTYRDLARFPDETLADLDRFLGLEPEPGQKEYWNFEHHGSQKADYEWVKQQRTQFLDLRWKEFLSEADQRWVLAEPRVGRYLAEIGLEFVEDGLTRKR